MVATYASWNNLPGEGSAAKRKWTLRKLDQAAIKAITAKNRTTHVVP